MLGGVYCVGRFLDRACLCAAWAPVLVSGLRYKVCVCCQVPSLFPQHSPKLPTAPGKGRSVYICVCVCVCVCVNAFVSVCVCVCVAIVDDEIVDDMGPSL